jgi:hypothetical protein
MATQVATSVISDKVAPTIAISSKHSSLKVGQTANYLGHLGAEKPDHSNIEALVDCDTTGATASPTRELT